MVELLLPKQLTRVRFPSPAPIRSAIRTADLIAACADASIESAIAMKIAILSRNSSLYSTSRLVDAGRARGHRVRVLDPLRCYMRISGSGFDMHYKGRALKDLDAVIPRIGSSITFYGTAVLRQFEMMGIQTPNSSDALLRARDKLRSLQMLAREGIDLPRTVFGDYPDDTSDLLQMLGDPPHVIKLNEGAQGKGVLLAEKRSASQGMIEAFRGLYANFVVQEFIAEAGGGDLRCFVIDGRVAAAMHRQAPEGDFRANLHRGGTASPVELTEQESTVAIRAAATMGLGIAGVDLLRSRRGPLVLEVNASPGLEGIEQATGKDIAGEIIAFVERAVLANKAAPKPRRKAKSA
jgi:ribosomal protein S6--L-glutamate ligase